MKYDSLYNKIYSEYYWPTMKSDIMHFLANCEHCSYMNPKFIEKPHLTPTQKGNKPFSIIHIDLTGDLQLTKTSHGNRYIAIFIDSFSKWIELYPIPNKQAETIAACFTDYFKRFGCPH